MRFASDVARPRTIARLAQRLSAERIGVSPSLSSQAEDTNGARCPHKASEVRGVARCDDRVLILQGGGDHKGIDSVRGGELMPGEKLACALGN